MLAFLAAETVSKKLFNLIAHGGGPPAAAEGTATAYGTWTADGR
jgi:hypothetical protein